MVAEEEAGAVVVVALTLAGAEVAMVAGAEVAGADTLGAVTAVTAWDTAGMVMAITAGAVAMVLSSSVATTIMVHPTATTTTGTTTRPMSRTHARPPISSVSALTSTNRKEIHGLGLSVASSQLFLSDSVASASALVNVGVEGTTEAAAAGLAQEAAGQTLAAVITAGSAGDATTEISQWRGLSQG